MTFHQRRHQGILTTIQLPGWVRLAVVFCCMTSQFACGGETAQDSEGTATSTDGRPNVVLITLDTFRPDHLQSYGYPKATGPFLDRVIAGGTFFRQSYATSTWTAPSTSSLFTGLYPTRHGVTQGFLAHQKRSAALEDLVGTKLLLNRLPEDVATLPEILRQAGYQTFGVASNINIGREIGFDRGFDRFRKMQDVDAEKLAEQVKIWHSEGLPSAPRFLYLHFNDVHEPYRVRPQWYEEPQVESGQDAELARTVAAYNSEISYLDSVLERLYEDLSWQENTLLIIVSDHGEEFGEHGKIGHQFSVHHELMRTLMVFSGTDLGIPQGDITMHVSLIDILPTVLDFLQLPALEGVDGLSLRPWLQADSPSVAEQRHFRKRTLFAHRQRYRVRQGKEPEQLWAAVRGPWKLIDNERRQRLFHLQKDPTEQRNRARFREALVKELTDDLEAFRANGFRVSGEQTEVELDEETLESLRSLGYIQ